MPAEILPFLMAGLAGLVGGIWGFSEIIGEFKIESGLAFRTGGAWMLVLVNFVAAAIVFLILITIVPTGQTWITALLTGMAWPTIFRNASLKLSQPLDDANSKNTAAVRVEQAYASTQKLALQLINGSLTQQRNRLLAQAIRYNLADILTFTRNQIAISPQQGETKETLDYVDTIIQRNITEEEKKAYLIAVLLNRFGRPTLEELLKKPISA